MTTMAPATLKAQISDLEAQLARLRAAEAPTAPDSLDLVSNLVEFFENSPIGKIIGAPNGTLLHVNQAFANMLGYTREELLGIDPTLLTHPDDIETSLEIRQALLTQKISSSAFDKRYRKKDGSFIWTHASAWLRRTATGEPLHFLTHVEDISTRRHAAETLRLSEVKFRNVFQLIPDALCITRISDGVYMDVNAGFTTLTGMTADEARGRSARVRETATWVDDDERARVVNDIRKFGQVQNIEARFWKKGGGEFIGLLSARIIEVDGEHCILSITRDVTAMKATENAVRAQLQELQRWYKLAIDREERIHSLKLEVNHALARLGEAPRYSVEPSADALPPGKA